MYAGASSRRAAHVLDASILIVFQLLAYRPTHLYKPRITKSNPVEENIHATHHTHTYMHTEGNRGLEVKGGR
jgi:hypothetical protein